MTMTPDVSLLVCTRDRGAALSTLLASVARAVAQAPAIAIEAVIVDNGSRDDTAERLRPWAADQHFPVRLLQEERPGLARARNAGLAAVRGRIVAMTDDDCVLHPDYFAGLVGVFAEIDRPAVIGGRILPGNAADLPVTLKTEDHPMVAAPEAFPGGFVMGANLALSAEVIARVGRFDERFGAGARFVAAEDTDFLLRVQHAGFAILYDPRFTVDHHHGRRAIPDETRLLAGYSFGDGALYAKHWRGDRRVRAFLLRDVASVVQDVTRPITTHRGIRHFYLFRLRHKLRGMVAYWTAPAEAEAARRHAG